MKNAPVYNEFHGCLWEIPSAAIRQNCSAFSLAYILDISQIGEKKMLLIRLFYCYYTQTVLCTTVNCFAKILNGTFYHWLECILLNLPNTTTDLEEIIRVIDMSH